MKLLHRYLLVQLVRNITLSLLVFVLLYITLDFLDRIDNIVAERASIFHTAQYFLYKIPLSITLMMPIAMLVGVLFTMGILSKNSEITAMRASGLTVLWIARPLLLVGGILSLLSLALNETLVPFATRRVKEIYNIDIRQKDKRGAYSQNDLWWRTGNDFFSVGAFDSRTATLHEVSRLDISEDFSISRRTDATTAHWIDATLGWSMNGVTEYRFSPDSPLEIRRFQSLPLTIRESPESFYNVETEPDTMSFRALRSFIKRQARNGINIRGYLADLHAKLAFPFLNLIIVLVVLPFVMKGSRHGSLAGGVVAALVIGFSYYAVHSFSISLGRAEIWHPILAAWMANGVMGLIGLVLVLGAESPQ